MEKSWIDEAVEREATPKPLRMNTVEEFCKKYDIAENTYYYQLRKEENRKRILEICLNKAKDEAPEVLTVLVEKAKKGDMKAMSIYMDSILQLAKNIGIKMDAKLTIEVSSELANKYALTQGSIGDSK